MNDQIFTQQTFLKAPIEQVFSFFCDAHNLEKITPPWLQFKILNQSTPTIQKGTTFTYRLKIHGVPVHWTTLIEEWVPNTYFVDTQIKGPYRKWHHTHTFQSMDGGTQVNDRILYKMHFGRIGHLFAGKWVRRDVETIFAYREKAIEAIFSQDKS